MASDVDEKSFEEVNNEFLAETIIQISLLGIYIFVGVVSNVTVLLVYTLKMKGHRHQRFFVPYLAVTDLLSCSYNGSGKIALYIMALRFDSDPLCKSGQVLGFTLNAFSFWLLFTIALQRYLLICRTSVHFSTRYKLAVLACGVVLSACFGVPRFLFARKMDFTIPGTNLTGYRCGLSANQDGSNDLKIYTTVASIGMVILITAITLLYCLVIRKIRTVSSRMERHHSISVTSQSMSESDVKPSTSSKSVEREGTSTLGSLKKNRLESTRSDASLKFRRKRADRNRITYMFFFISVTALITSLPRIILDRIESTNEAYFFSLTPVERGFYMFFHGLYILNNAINPFVYGLFDAVFRKNLRKMFKKLLPNY